MNNKYNRILSFVLAVILVIGTLPVGVFADSNVDLNESEKITEEVKVEEKMKKENDIEKEVKIENPAEEDIKIEEEPEIQPKIIEDAVEISEDSELIEISPVDITDLPAATSLNTAEEVLPTEVLGNKIENVSIEWRGYPSNKTLDLNWEGTGNDSKSLRFRIKFNLSGQNFYKEGAISMIIPKSIFQDRDGNPLGYMSLAVPEAPNKRATFAYIDLGDKYLITNTKTLSPATGAFIDGTIKGLIPSKIKDKVTGYKSDDLYVDLKIDVDDPVNKGSVQTMGKKSNLLNAKVNTGARVIQAYKKFDGMYWNHDFIPKELLPDNPDDYVYAKWTTSTDISGNQPFAISIKDKTSADNGIDSKVIGFIINSSGEIVKNDTLSDTIRSKIFEGYQDSFDSSFYLTFYTAHLKENIKKDESFVLRNNIEYILTTQDDNEVSKKDYTESFIYNPPEEEKPVVRTDSVYIKTGGWYKDEQYLTGDDYKNVMGLGYGSKSVGLYNYALNELNEKKPIEISYNTNASVYGRNATLKKGGNPDNVNDYNQVPYTFEISSNELTFNGKTLTSSDDFEYKSINILKPVLDKNEKLPIVDVFATINNSEVKVASLNYTDEFTTAQTFNGASFIDDRVIFPKGTTSYKISFSTKESRAEITAFPTIIVKPSRGILEEVTKLFKNSSTPEADINNTVNLRVHNENADIIDESTGKNLLQSFAYGAQLTKRLADYRNNKEDRMILLDYELRAITQTNITSKSVLDEIISKGLFEDETSQTWYDLLPPGVTVKTDTIKIYNGVVLSKKIITNYKKNRKRLTCC